jgi:glycosyltransferase involved in cell wall biosynthesis
MATVSVRVHPGSSFAYYGFYLSGLKRSGRLRLRFDRRDMPDLTEPKAGLALETADGRRVFIAANDHPTIDPAALAWSDVLGIVNHDPAEPGAADPKVIALGPGFGVRWHGFAHAVSYVARCAAADGASAHTARMTASRLKAAVAHQRSRSPLALYRPAASDPGYLFFLATNWSRHPEVNPAREAFVATARAVPGLRFEGGLVGADGSGVRRYRHREYLELTGRSVLAFNTPAVHRCLGWKLGEFLALGKAIVSLPLTRSMPEPLEHGVNVHWVDGSAGAITDALDRIRADHAYRASLERGARGYWERWLAPEVVMRRLIVGDTR